MSLPNVIQLGPLKVENEPGEERPVSPGAMQRQLPPFLLVPL